MLPNVNDSETEGYRVTVKRGSVEVANCAIDIPLVNLTSQLFACPGLDIGPQHTVRVSAINCDPPQEGEGDTFIIHPQVPNPPIPFVSDGVYFNSSRELRVAAIWQRMLSPNMSDRCTYNTTVSYFLEVNVTTVDTVIVNTSIPLANVTDDNYTNSTGIEFNVTTSLIFTEEIAHSELVQSSVCHRNNNCSVTINVESIPPTVHSYQVIIRAVNSYGFSEPSFFPQKEVMSGSYGYIPTSIIYSVTLVSTAIVVCFNM